jgi:hypothetical protein
MFMEDMESDTIDKGDGLLADEASVYAHVLIHA